jgi:hypothetical protein
LAKGVLTNKEKNAYWLAKRRGNPDEEEDAEDKPEEEEDSEGEAQEKEEVDVESSWSKSTVLTPSQGNRWR